MTLKKLRDLLNWIEGAYASVGGVSMHGSHIWCSGGGELSISFNTQPPQSLDKLLKRKGFNVWQNDYIYRPRTRGATRQ